MNSTSLLNLYLIFVKIGAILLSGGYVILPLITNEFVEKRSLIEKEEIVDYFALAQSLPGIIAANISMFIGYKLRGKRGALLAMLGVITVPFFCIVALASLLSILTENQYVQSVFWAVGIAVIALILLTMRELWQNTKKDLSFYIVFFLALTSLVIFEFSPIKTIIIFTLLGVILKKVIKQKEAE